MSAPHSRVLYASAGYTTHDRRFLDAAVAHGWDVHFARFDGGSGDLEHRSPPSGVTAVEWLGTREPLHADNVAEFVDAFRDMAVGVCPTVVHAGPVPTVGYVAVAAAAAPVVVMSWASDLLVDVPASPLVHERAVQALRGAAHVLVDCETVAGIARELGAPPDEITIVPWGIDLDGFPYSPPEQVTGPLRLVSLRTLEPVYDVATLLRALARARALAGGDLVLSVAGSGSQADALRALADELDLASAVDFLGRIPEDGVAALLRAHDVHVSTAWSDGTSISLLQSLATGRPSVLTDLPSNREWVTPGVNGWMFTPGDPDSLARCLLAACAARLQLPAIARRGRVLAEKRADWMKNRDRVHRAYERVSRSARLGIEG